MLGGGAPGQLYFGGISPAGAVALPLAFGGGSEGPVSLGGGTLFAINGNLYYVGRSATQVAMWKAADPTAGWAWMDAANGPVRSNTYWVNAVAVGGVIHVIEHYDTGTTLRYSQFDTATDTWIVNEVVATGVALATNCAVGITVRSNGDVIIAHGNGTNAYYRKRVAGVWGGAVLIGTGSESVHCIVGAADRVHFFWSATTAAYLHRSLSSTDVFDTQATMASDKSTTIVASIPKALTDGSGTHIRVGYATTLYPKVITFDSGANPTFAVDTIEATTTTSQTAGLAIDPGTQTIHALWPSSSTTHLNYNKSPSLGGSWSANVDTGGTGARAAMVVYTRGTAIVLAYVYSTSAAGTTYYNEIALGRARTFAPTQAQTVSYTRPRSRTLTVTQSQTAVVVQSATRPQAVTQAQSVTRSIAIARTVTLTQTQAVARVRVAARTLTLTQAQAVARAGVVTRTLGLTQGQGVVVASASAGVAAVSQAQAVSVVRQVNRCVALTQAQAANLARVAAHAQLVVQGAAVSRSAVASRVFGAQQSQDVRLAPGKSFAAALTQAQAVGRRMGGVARHSVSQAASVAVTHGSASSTLVTATQNAALRLTAQGQSIRKATQAATARLSRTVRRTVSAASPASATVRRAMPTVVPLMQEQEVEAAHTRTLVRFVVARQWAAVVPTGGHFRTLRVAQPSAATVTRALSHTLLVTQAQTVSRKVKYPPRYAKSDVVLEALGDIEMDVLPDAILSVGARMGSLTVEVNS